ncbi:hypothetical protein [Legionella cardiaca]|uniref:Dot/Icm secretion system substrate n=1 Tax=Legionella cardiaca TaxID=1071983 RepID=A0ABY8ASI2_9GAMM|nr:hypothetical protein [Legionella cardiaca]WED43493.1 hypothetical protein PXX05_01595 [Legionella cardiaca]
METNEHRQAGNQIRIETLDNLYLQGSKSILPKPDDEPLRVTMMRQLDGIPVPLDKLQLTAGDIVALAGDYYTKAGWGLELNIGKTAGQAAVKNNKRLFKNPVVAKEILAFTEAYGDLASPDVNLENIEHIYKVEETTYIPFFKSINAIFQQLVYSWTVKGYKEKLNKNEAHFTPWSARAYIVGHHTALKMAEIAFACKNLSSGKLVLEDLQKSISTELTRVLKQIQDNPTRYKFENLTSPAAIYEELAARYHALAIAQDLFTMHFYSDHFAGGHMSRIGILRKTMPERFSVFGSILINNMHNEDNLRSVTVHNPHQPCTDSDKILKMYPVIDEAYGDGTYFLNGNNNNSDMLVNGMTNSLGDIARVMESGIIPPEAHYGGLCFLPEVDYQKPQTQPLLINGKDGNIYFRSNISQIKTLMPTEYRDALEQPQNHGYEKLTLWKAFVLVFKLRVLGFIYSPSIIKNLATEVAQEKPATIINGTDEMKGLNVEPTNLLSATSQIEQEKEFQASWRMTPPTSLANAHSVHGFINKPPSPISQDSTLSSPSLY